MRSMEGTTRSSGGYRVGDLNKGQGAASSDAASRLSTAQAFSRVLQRGAQALEQGDASGQFRHLGFGSLRAQRDRKNNLQRPHG